MVGDLRLVGEKGGLGKVAEGNEVIEEDVLSSTNESAAPRSCNVRLVRDCMFVRMRAAVRSPLVRGWGWIMGAVGGEEGVDDGL